MTTTCEKCGSDKIIPVVHVSDQGQYSDGSLKVAIAGKPEAMFFRDVVFGQLKAQICGECGHTEPKVQNPQALYRRYQQTLGVSE